MSSVDAAPEHAGARMDASARLRIEMVLPTLEPAGMETVVATLARALAARGHEVGVTCLLGAGALAPSLEADGIRVAEVPTPGLLANVHAPALVAHFRRRRPHVVHTHSGVWLKDAQAARRAGVPAVVHTEHGLLEQEPWFSPGLKRRAAARTDAIAAVSEPLADDLRNRIRVPAARVITLPNGVDVERFAPGRPDGALRRRLGIPLDAPLVGTIARLAPVKNQALLLDAFALVLPDVPDAHVVLVGDGELREALQTQAERLGIAARVHLAGALADPAAAYRELSAFTLTSLAEGTSISLLEAMASGVPPVVTAVGGNPAAVAHGVAGLLTPSGDATALAATLRRLLTDAALARAIGAAARRHVLGHYTESTMADAHEALYRRALGAAAPPRLTPAA